MKLFTLQLMRKITTSVAQANEPLDEEGHFVNNNVSGRFREETSQFDKKRIDLMDVSPRDGILSCYIYDSFLTER